MSRNGGDTSLRGLGPRPGNLGDRRRSKDGTPGEWLWRPRRSV